MYAKNNYCIETLCIEFTFKLLTKQKFVPNKFEFSSKGSKVSNMVKIMHILFI